MEIDNLKSTIKNALLTMTMHALHVLPIKSNKLLFQSYYGKYYNDNPKLISDKLLGKGLDIVWVTSEKKDLPDSIRQVDPSSFRYLYDLATSKVWVDNCRKRSWVRKKKGQYYIQTWHGNLGNKRAEGAAIDALSEDYIRRAKIDAGMTDLMISGSTFFTELIRKYFWFDGEIMECGTPRLDLFYKDNETLLERVREQLGIDRDAKVALYAPTFRSDLKTDCYKLDFDRVIEALEKKGDEKWVLLVRLHPNISDKTDFISYSDNIINATSYQDLYELILLSEIVISDYSSLTFEAGMIGKPVFLFALDLNEYIMERGFYIDIREQPYILAESNDELIKKLMGFDYDSYRKELDAFNQSLGIKENGSASEKLAERILDVING